MLANQYLVKLIIKKLELGVNRCVSLHPLKNINVWSDGGIITTNKQSIYNKLLLLRNHGLKNRDEVEILGFNSRRYFSSCSWELVTA